ncbi:MAG: DUF1588 domain-containing protein [Myxococcota bacterium]
MLLAGCTGSIVGPRGDDTSSTPAGGGRGGGSNVVGGGTGGTVGGGGGGGEVTPAGPPVFAPAGIRRMTRGEIQTAAGALLGVSATALGDALGTDMRQSGFTRNADQRLGSVEADALWQATQTLAHTAVTQRLSALAPCTTSGGSEACAQTFIRAFATKAFRRAPTAAEETALLTVYRAGRQDATYAMGIELVIGAVLQSASFLYVTELGGAPTDGVTKLTGDELATNLALLLTGALPDDALLAAGRSGALDTPDGREAKARALLATPTARRQLERLVLEWLASDEVDVLPKDSGLFPQWGAVRGDVLAESRAIVDAVLFDGGDGTLTSLLSTDRTQLTSQLASFYGVTDLVMQPAYRRGLLLAGGFTAANSHPTATAPVKRGAVVRKKMLCQELPLPTLAPGQTIVVPPADPNRTTRERFAAHSSAPACAGCHTMLDPIGFALESFDTVGRYRTTENGKPIDTTGELINAGDATGSFTDAVELAQLLARSKTVTECFERQLFRFAAGRSGTDEERTFVEAVRDRPSARDGKVVELLVDYVRSDSFALRRLQ